MIDGSVVRAALAVLVATLFAVDLAVVWDRAGSWDGGSATDVVVGAASAQDEAVIAELVAFVEAERGLEFLEPPKVEILGRRAFLAALHNLPTGTDVAEPEVRVDFTAVLVLEALGVVDGDFDVAAAAEAASDAVVGFYDPRATKLFVNATDLGSFARSVVVHELTHALDDQHFGLTGLLRPGLDDDARDAFLALVEGSAGRVEDAFVASLSPVERASLASQDPTAGVGAGIPDYFVARSRFAYEAGPAFVDHLVAAGGLELLNRAFSDPPTTTEQVINPERYLARQPRVTMSEPRALGPVIQRGTLGELGLQLVLAEVLAIGEAAAAARGWGADRLVAWSSGRDVCLRWDIKMDTGADLADLAGAFARVVEANPRSRFEVTDRLRFTNCVR